MVNRLIFVLILTFGSSLYAQTSECKVTKASISGSYSGGCKNGLAQGKGIAQGIDRYEGQFVKGLPSGTGVYKWANGVYYEGEWKKGLMEGEGKMVYPDSIVTGVWKEDKYMGKKAIEPYKIITSMSVSRFQMSKSSDRSYKVKIQIKQGGIDNISIENFSLAYDSGSEYRSGNYYGLDNVRFPLNLKIKYSSWNQLMTSQYTVIFEVVINDPGSWDIILVN
jgi:hypothetical protein